MLHEFVMENRNELVTRCKAKVAERKPGLRSDPDFEHGIPMFLDQLSNMLHWETSGYPTIGASATLNGGEMLRQGFTVEQVVHTYGDVCQSVTDLALELNSPISTTEFRTLNKCLDGAIADAVTEHGRIRDQRTAAAHTERIESFAHEVDYLVGGAAAAFNAIREGTVGVSGSTGALLERNLTALRTLADSVLTEVGLGTKQT